MRRSRKIDTSDAVTLPQHLQDVLSDLPTNVDRRTGADLITRHFFPVSYRTLEAWPLPTRHVNGKAIVPTANLFVVAFAKLNAATVIMGGRRTATRQDSALTGAQPR
jgi:hypothetical protein